MKTLLFEKLILETRLSTEEVLERLEGHVVHSEGAIVDAPEGQNAKKPFSGLIEKDSFSIYPLWNRSRFGKPFIVGKIKKGLSRTSIDVKIVLNPLLTSVIIAFTFFAGLTLWYVGIPDLKLLTDDYQAWPLFLAGLFYTVLLAYLVVGYIKDAKFSKQKLLEILEASMGKMKA